jgi:hypothetical protein
MWIASLVLAVAGQGHVGTGQFAEWGNLYGKVYSTEAERSFRLEQWQHALQRAPFGISGLTPYSDCTLTELAAIFPAVGARSAVPAAPEYPFTPFSQAYVATAVAAGVDWRAKGVVSPVSS